MTKRATLYCILLAASVSAAGCSTGTLNVTYVSQPPGAALYEDGRTFGYCPLTLQYNITEQDRQRGYAILRGLLVRWVSGATASVSSIQANLSNGSHQEFTFVRPEGATGLEIDVKFALDLERNRILQRQAEAQEQQAFWQMYNAVTIQHQLSKPQTCSSYVVGNTIQTQCR